MGLHTYIILNYKDYEFRNLPNLNPLSQDQKYEGQTTKEKEIMHIEWYFGMKIWF